MQLETNMKAVIIDDSANACTDLKNHLSAYDFIQVLGEAHNGFDGLDLINKTKPDVLFLDVEMPDISGLDFISRSSYLQESECRIVIYTAYEKYVLPALRKRVDDVLLKPIDDDDLKGVVERLQNPAKVKKNNFSKPGESKSPRYVLFTNSVDFTIIGKSDVGLFQYEPSTRTWSAVVAGLEHPVRLRSKINAKAITQLGPQYVQVHQKFIINVDYLLNVVDGLCHFFPPFDKIDYVTVGRVYREKLLSRFLSL